MWYGCHNATSPGRGQSLVNRHSKKEVSHGQRVDEFWGQRSSAGFFTAGLCSALDIATVWAGMNGPKYERA